MKKRKGITLIELIISIAIIGIISVTMLNVFDMGLYNISRAGLRTETVLLVKETIDTAILDNNVGIPTEITVDLPGDKEVLVQGSIIESSITDSKSNNVTITTFITN